MRQTFNLKNWAPHHLATTEATVKHDDGSITLKGVSSLVKDRPRCQSWEKDEHWQILRGL